MLAVVPTSSRSVVLSSVLLVPEYSSTWAPSMPYASRVALRFFSTYGASLACSFGWTWNFWTMAGYRPPIRIAESTIRPKPITGSCQVRRHRVAKNSRRR